MLFFIYIISRPLSTLSTRFFHVHYIFMQISLSGFFRFLFGMFSIFYQLIAFWRLEVENVIQKLGITINLILWPSDAQNLLQLVMLVSI